MKKFIKKIDLCTYAFENLSYKVLKSIADKKEVHPSPDTLRIAQNRILEKKFANDLGIKTTEWKSVKSLEELKEGVKTYGNCILKSVSGGYDGKQQYRFKTVADIDNKIDFSKEYILEKFLKFKQEISVAATRYKDSKISIFEPTENQHAGGILRHSKIPANISKKIFNDDGSHYFKKHKIFLYKEDFEKFKDALAESVDYIFKNKGQEIISATKNESKDGDSSFTDVNLKISKT